jgi:hypothetical protein
MASSMMEPVGLKAAENSQKDLEKGSCIDM